MKRTDLLKPRAPASIRVRLGLALAIALLPVLILSGVQADLEFRRESREQSASLLAAAQRSAASANSRIETAQILLQALAPETGGPDCPQRLAAVARRVPGYQNLIRFDAAGRVACAAAAAPADPGRAGRPWFRALAVGAPMVVARDAGAIYARAPSILVATPIPGPDGRFTGAMASVIAVSSLRPDQVVGALPPGADVTVFDLQGRRLTGLDLGPLPPKAAALLRARPAGLGRSQAWIWSEPERDGRSRIYAAAPLAGDQILIVLSAPNAGLATWAWLNPISAVALPLLAFTLALAAVWIVAERGVIRWIAYLQRIAALYVRGRFAVRPVRAEQAPPEIRDLAETLGDMAAAIAARDEALVGHLAQKDAMLREIHHRVKNNLQVISSLLNLQQRTLNDPAARAAVSDTRQRIGALALIYRALYQSPDLKRVDLHDFLEELIGQVVTGESGLAPPVRTDLDCEPLEIDPDLLAPLALFAVEAISNARKHGLEHDGLLTVSFGVHDSEAELAICDTGQRGRRSVVGPGVGRTLMTAFSRQLRGAVSFRANPEGGLTARLTFPAPEIRVGAPDSGEHPVPAPASRGQWQGEGANPAAGR